MRTTRACGRQLTLALIFGSLAAFPASYAAACGQDYEIRSGDTLSRIAAKCDTTVSALTRANEVDPRSLQLGDILSIPSAGGADGPVARESSRTRPAEADQAEEAAGYEVRAGDTPAAIAASLGISVEMLLDVNPDINPHALRIGQRLDVPDSEEINEILAEREAERERLFEIIAAHPDPRLSLSKGEWRLTVDIEAEGLGPSEPVGVSVSGDGSDWIELGEMPADEDGDMIARARIPAELVDAPTLHFAIERFTGDRLSAKYADGAGGTMGVVKRSGGAPDGIEVAGKVVRGGGCSLLVTRQGDTYALIGQRGNISPGSEVLVQGATVAESPECVGHAVLQVQSVEPLPRG